MSLIYPKRIRQVLRGENPKIFVAGFDKKDQPVKEVVDQVKDKDGNIYDVFEEGGKRYVMQGNAKVNAKFFETDPVGMPMFCPKCGSIMKTHLDKKMWNIHTVCFGCAIKIEDSLRKSNKWETYQKQRILLNKKSLATEMLSEVNSLIEAGVDKIINYVNSDGKLEKWENQDRDKIIEYLDSERETLIKELETINKELEETGEILYVKYN